MYYSPEGPFLSQEAVIKTILKKNEYKKAKWLSEEALQIAEKRREVKGKGKKKRYTHLDAEFQRTARRDKKAFLMEKAMAPHSSTLAWKIPWAEEPGKLQSMGSRRAGHD